MANNLQQRESLTAEDEIGVHQTDDYHDAMEFALSFAKVSNAATWVKRGRKKIFEYGKY